MLFVIVFYLVFIYPCRAIIIKPKPKAILNPEELKDQNKRNVMINPINKAF